MSISEIKGLRVAKWGNSLAVRLPQAFAAELGGAGSTLKLTMGALPSAACSQVGLGEAEQARYGEAPAEAVIGKWGNSLAVRLPQRLTQQAGLKEGDEVRLRPAEDGSLAVVREATVDELFAALRALRRSFPADWKFDRDEANSRGPNENE